jgi:hypothetical protein
MSGGKQGEPRRRNPCGPPRLAIAALLSVLASTAALAARTLYLAENELICDSGRIICIHGTLGYDVNDRLLWLRGRVQATTVPGTLQITVKGTNGLGHVRYAPLEIELQGRASEIVDFAMIPDYPDVANWEIWTIEYRLGQD